MKVKLINTVKLFRDTFPPYGLGLINAFLNNNSIESDIFDLDIVVKHQNSLLDMRLFIDLDYLRMNYDDIYDMLKLGILDPYFDIQFEKFVNKIDFNDVDVAGLTCPDNEIYTSLYLAKKIKNKFGCTTIIGGTHIVRMSSNRLRYFIDTLKVNYVDYFVKEKEYDFFLGLLGGKLPKHQNRAKIFPYKKELNHQCGVKFDKKCFINFDIPLYNKEHLALYKIDIKKIKHFYPRLNSTLVDKFSKLGGEPVLILPYVFTKGCPNNCAFCFAGLQKFEEEDVDITISRIKTMQKEYDCNNFFFLNNNIIANKKNAEILFKRLKNEMSIKWCDSCAINGLDDPMLKLMSSSGCIQLLFGLESGSQRILEYVHKNINYNKIKFYTECFKNCNKNNIWVVADLIAGIPYETDEDVERTLNCLDLNRDLINGILTLPFALHEDSAMYKNPSKYGLRILDEKVARKRIKEKYGANVDVYKKIYYRDILFDEVNGLDCWKKQKQIKASKQKIGNYAYKNFTTQFSIHYAIFYLYNLFNGNKKEIISYLER